MAMNRMNCFYQIEEGELILVYYVKIILGLEIDKEKEVHVGHQLPIGWLSRDLVFSHPTTRILPYL